MIKQKLLALGIVEDNEFLNMYCELIENNFSTPKEKFKTQAHHIIPKFILKTNWVVNLSNYNHALAHYYLCFCLIDKYKFGNENAFFKMINCNCFEDVEKSLKKYNELYKDYCKRNSESNKEYYRSHPERSINHSIKLKEMYKNNPQKRIEKSETMKKYYKEHPEAIEKMSERSKKQKMTTEKQEKLRQGYEKNRDKIIKNLSLLRKGENNPAKRPEVREKMRKSSKRKKAVLQINKNGKIIKEYESVMEASRQLKITDSAIRAACKGKNKTCKNYYWRFK